MKLIEAIHSGDSRERIDEVLGQALKTGKKVVGCLTKFMRTLALKVFNEDSEVVTGVVIEKPEQPTIQYVYEYEGDTLYYYSSTKSTPPNYTIGEEVEVHFDKDNLKDAVVNSFSERWLIETVFGVFGLILLFVSKSIQSFIERKLG